MRYLIILLTTFLLSCKSYIYRTENINEQLHAFIFKDQKVYVLGEKYDYVFENADISAFQEFMQSSFVSQILSVDVNMNATDELFFAEYAVYLDPKKYTSAEKEILQKYFWFNPLTRIKSDVVEKMPSQLTWKSDAPALKRQYRAVGKRIVLKNRGDLLEKYGKNKPLPLVYQHDFSRPKIADEIEEFTILTLSVPLLTAQSVAMLAISPIIIPILIFQ